jgi:hypothetical protein
LALANAFCTGFSHKKSFAKANKMPKILNMPFKMK